ncbi:ethanolamine ammonia-lyase subunit EutC [Dinghuibacter silviterrae]|uniref:Ethanolamine ammonia-lyase small subunit n=1 Tax=Dinghuibacter silviterrae TaxID=1539049 RepID=A0A4R8DG79_9BACT|nr:ethanolamine ammonia-lyase subunit EutC [Dinghuibacter silviterrae]TDW96116.1 ethanolamine ammonia-lyase light chain [Dinghuibacter silviterrae]
MKPIVEEDAWSALRAFTPARIALGRTGNALPLKEVLHFRMAHAHARDAVYSRLNVEGLDALGLPVMALHSQARDRHTYLQRPDLGRLLDERSAATLEHGAYDLVFVIADGLSATAVNHHAVPLLHRLIPALQETGIRLAPLCLLEEGRVAAGDPIAHLLGARMSIVLIGERPGLSAADSMGAYMTFAPRPGLTDESRNCVSNIRPEGLFYAAAADRLLHLIGASMRLGLSGVGLKDQSGGGENTFLE